MIAAEAQAPGDVLADRAEAASESLPDRLRRLVPRGPGARVDAHAFRRAVIDGGNDPARDLARLMGVARLTKDTRAYLGDCIVHAAGSAGSGA